MEQQTQKYTGGKEECLLCRITYSIFSNFPSMPSAMALNVETGVWFPHDRLRSYSTGYQMADALGYAWACKCRERASKRYDEQVTLVDRVTGQPLRNFPYRFRAEGGTVMQGITGADGLTGRVKTAEAIDLDLEHTIGEGDGWE
ncbi:hypothetical protein [Paraburkholderia sp. HP33-1]|uniref:hypothetical protein n=1 Tax=Paraburkholderia sp. HP33-1 TaxID=2883243 RepID=UPI001F48977D|nr:hypothetical protein [Paraburkholderia sp. HP33-1]